MTHPDDTPFSDSVLDHSVLDDARRLHGDLVRLRHRLHQEPEIGLSLPRTQEKVLQALDGLPYEITLGTDTTSVTAVLRGQGSHGPAATSTTRPVVLLRGDMDALPVQEQTGVEYTSHIDGAMHACGHDLHTAMLAGAATLLADRRDRLAGDVVLMFQPGEEGFDGAGVMIREGVLEAAGRAPDAAYGLHVMSALQPNGQLATRPGTLMSASDGLHVTVHGAGGHGSAPHLAKDPVTAAAEMVTALQVMITRQFNMFDPVVVTVGVLRAGTKRNVIPESAVFEATVRTFSEANREKMQAVVPRLLEGIAAAHGLEVTVNYSTEYPLTVTDHAETVRAESVIAGLFGSGRYSRMAQPLSGSEDFSRILAAVPGSFIFLSAVTPDADPATSAFNHSPYATFDDNVLADGAALYAQLALSRIAELAAVGS
ncbi:MULTISPECIES: M20 metallopeptidase family protein [unclassified Arthrobacter]|uniref:M20 metallopeptidase family protein n=1 Tax=unclassified Arthrobacter TaxID=235627 RepID=UPI001491B595|nr:MULTISPECIES: M20 family metallopeptidase [unclassified Arthrobacter]MBE0009120.1 amidohydrolase [Arthrobacter sp. AET 35A]NOJ63071.1 amidohydrolase [Arthrobacter sp. 147(2020)]